MWGMTKRPVTLLCVTVNILLVSGLCSAQEERFARTMGLRLLGELSGGRDFELTINKSAGNTALEETTTTQEQSGSHPEVLSEFRFVIDSVTIEIPDEAIHDLKEIIIESVYVKERGLSTIIYLSTYQDKHIYRSRFIFENNKLVRRETTQDRSNWDNVTVVSF